MTFTMPKEQQEALLNQPKFTHLKCCNRCPSNVPFQELDPEAQDALKGNWEEYMLDFPCAWRTEGFCKGHAVKRHEFGNN